MSLVRGSPGGFAPSQIPGLKLWFNAGALSLNNNDPVSSWTDLSGQGNHATQATGTKQPTYKTNVLNGRPVVRFDGVDDYLQTAAFSAPLSQPSTMFVVCSFSGLSDTATDGLTAGARHLLVQSGATTVGISAGTYLSYTDASPSGVSIWSALYNGTTSELYRNGASKAAGNAGTNQLAGLTIGADHRAPAAADYIQGDMPEIILYNRALSASERRTVEQYLGRRYGVAVV